MPTPRGRTTCPCGGAKATHLKWHFITQHLNDAFDERKFTFLDFPNVIQVFVGFLAQTAVALGLSQVKRSGGICTAEWHRHPTWCLFFSCGEKVFILC